MFYSVRASQTLGNLSDNLRPLLHALRTDGDMSAYSIKSGCNGPDMQVVNAPDPWDLLYGPGNRGQVEMLGHCLHQDIGRVSNQPDCVSENQDADESRNNWVNYQVTSCEDYCPAHYDPCG